MQNEMLTGFYAYLPFGNIHCLGAGQYSEYYRSVYCRPTPIRHVCGFALLTRQAALRGLRGEAHLRMLRRVCRGSEKGSRQVHPETRGRGCDAGYRQVVAAGPTFCESRANNRQGLGPCWPVLEATQRLRNSIPRLTNSVGSGQRSWKTPLDTPRSPGPVL